MPDDAPVTSQPLPLPRQYPERLLVRAVVLARVGGVSRETLWRWIREAGFPEPVRLNPTGTHIAWRESEVNAWIASRTRGGGRRPTEGLAERARRQANRKEGRTPKYGFMRRAP